tara:strand:- start:1826 stop:2080 length:255 start_codon:yes stop_codon:yes gene_type:complete
MSAARLHALHWAFFVDIMDMEFADVYKMFSAWCESVPADEMADIMALGDELFADDDTDDDQSDNLYTEEEIWNDTSSNADFSLN